MKIKNIILGTILGVGLCCVAGGGIGMVLGEGDRVVVKSAIEVGGVNSDRPLLLCPSFLHSLKQNDYDRKPTANQLNQLYNTFPPNPKINQLKNNMTLKQIKNFLCQQPTQEIVFRDDRAVVDFRIYEEPRYRK